MLSILDQKAATQAMIAEERRNAEAEQAKRNAKRFYDMGLNVDQIAKGLGYGVEPIKKWLGLQFA